MKPLDYEYTFIGLQAILLGSDRKVRVGYRSFHAMDLPEVLLETECAYLTNLLHILVF
jgi:hypothetical protein